MAVSPGPDPLRPEACTRGEGRWRRRVPSATCAIVASPLPSPFSHSRPHSHLPQTVTSPGGSPPADQSTAPTHGGAPLSKEETSATRTSTSAAIWSPVLIGISSSPETSSSSSAARMAASPSPSHLRTRSVQTCHFRAFPTTCTLDLLGFLLG
jgi:hypothetical protein